MSEVKRFDAQVFEFGEHGSTVTQVRCVEESDYAALEEKYKRVVEAAKSAEDTHRWCSDDAETDRWCSSCYRKESTEQRHLDICYWKKLDAALAALESREEEDGG